jgi:hypothetical protein
MPGSQKLMPFSSANAVDGSDNAMLKKTAAQRNEDCVGCFV